MLDSKIQTCNLKNANSKREFEKRYFFFDNFLRNWKRSEGLFFSPKFPQSFQSSTQLIKNVNQYFLKNFKFRWEQLLLNRIYKPNFVKIKLIVKLKFANKNSHVFVPQSKWVRIKFFIFLKLEFIWPFRAGSFVTKTCLLFSNRAFVHNEWILFIAFF